MEIRKYVFGLALILVLSGVGAAQQVKGVWRLDEAKSTGADGATEKMTQPNLYLFTKGHYSIIRVEGDKSRSTDDTAKMTAEQLLDTYVKNFTANAGTYEMKGSTLTTKVMVAKSPAYMQGGNWNTYTVKIDGQKMTWTSIATKDGPVKTPTTYTFTRVE